MNVPLQGKWFDMTKGSVATLALFLAYVTLPLAGTLPGLFVPLPAIFYSIKNGGANGAAIVAVSAAILAAVTGPATALLYILQCGIISLALAVCLDKGMGGARAIASAVALDIAVILLLAAAYSLSQGVDIHQQVVTGINSSISQTAALYEKSGLSGDELHALQQVLRQGGDMVTRVYPALVTIGLSLIAGINLLSVRRLYARLSRPLPIGDFWGFRNPEWLIWVLIAAGFAMLLDHRAITGTALNVLIVTLSLYFVQGLAVIGSFFDRLTVPVILRWIFYLFLAVQPYLAVAVAALGVFDLWGDFRTPKPRENL